MSAQRGRELERVWDCTEIEENIGEHDLLVAARAHPAGHLRLPLSQRFAPKRVCRHDVPSAQRKARLLKPPREPLCQRDEKPVDAFMLGIGMIGEDKAIVLIRTE